VAAAQLLLQHGANINATEQWQGQNAVIWAAAQSQPQMLELLLQVSYYTKVEKAYTTLLVSAIRTSMMEETILDDNEPTSH
jgi:ankyrin repeat protein